MICTLGYLIFGIMWIASCFTKEPLCAAYVKYRYGGDAALDNPIFMKPYEGASPMLLVDVEDREVLAGMVAAMLPQLPEPKKKRR